MVKLIVFSTVVNKQLALKGELLSGELITQSAQRGTPTRAPPAPRGVTKEALTGTPRLQRMRAVMPVT